MNPNILHNTLITADRLEVIRDYLNYIEVARVPGDVAEFGVYRGGSALLIARHSFTRTLRLFDTFEGIPEDDVSPEGHRAGEFACGLTHVRKLLESYEWRTEYHVGPFGRELPDTTYAFVHLDADTYQSTIAGLRYFWPRMNPGGVVVLDDYNWTRCPGVATAAHEIIGKAYLRQIAPYQAVAVKNSTHAVDRTRETV